MPLDDRPPLTGRAEPGWAAAIHLFGGAALHDRGCLGHVDAVRRRIDFPELAKRADAWSRRERILLCAAWALFDGGDPEAFADLLDGVPLSEAVGALSGTDLRRVLEAVRLCPPGQAPA